ncbi:cupin domain-containing protein [Desertibacillus haloalkaliphilus]|uniref:cupin domain-containing protein n=1 Tax=Desertibacillus haloalkaliphilus TaxID=1328930 RepID=UPI001C25C397|nr:cupin domain-containing protein [Desertibacillus haloalkaliphilus]MBU8908300.1 cupin domain-containing protein [Desertibacillus haloalkaliphilus]
MSKQSITYQQSEHIPRHTDWKPLRIEGISMKNLHQFEEGGSTVLIKMEPNSSFPLHNHEAEEEVYVVEGEVKVGKYHLEQGDYLFTSPETIHAPFSRKGCILLATTRKPLKFLNKKEDQSR